MSLPYVTAVRSQKDMSGDTVRFRGVGIQFTALANSITSYDYLVHATEMRLIDGTQLILSGHQLGDSIDFQLVDVNNVMGFGTNVVLDGFGANWWVASDKQDQGHIRFVYSAGIIPGLYIRVKYNNTSTTTDVQVRLNLFLHRPLV